MNLFAPFYYPHVLGPKEISAGPGLATSRISPNVLEQILRNEHTHIVRLLHGNFDEFVASKVDRSYLVMSVQSLFVDSFKSPETGVF